MNIAHKYRQKEKKKQDTVNVNKHELRNNYSLLVVIRLPPGVKPRQVACVPTV